MSLRPLTAQERAAALDKAARARTIRAEVKQKIKTGATSVEQVLLAADKEEALGRLKVSELLEALPGVGQVRAGAIMERIKIARTRRVRGLGVHQRKALIEFLGASTSQSGK
ncbi:integration host factor [Renibacterium salmoninarum ATCC 33209]|uniref:Integration host factor n=1 Tax=Renibacterium salmoninarum (strain ATCC 33209 / DSM 20767 / JCM 11484 / NBRC 15589 / NCIMB 2235) TaxID=288705 RepID=A9WSA5_RENSM|nr:integration host factor, actinobacterial type [Renibacterium salmoninarum]ABY23693.1 integration host factor [Renibacterium salmoninarum ATCC 33209]